MFGTKKFLCCMEICW